MFQIISSFNLIRKHYLRISNLLGFKTTSFHLSIILLFSEQRNEIDFTPVYTSRNVFRPIYTMSTDQMF